MKNGQTYLKILRCEKRKVFKVCVAIFQYYEWKDYQEKLLSTGLDMQMCC